jgi:hypothetical protein
MTQYLYRKSGRAVTLLLAGGVVLLLAATLWAQWGAPQRQRRSARAVAVLETYKNGSRRLIPITLSYQRRYYDANYYRAAPVPLALSAETVYEVQRFGKPLGTFTVQSATRGSSDAWTGNGFFRLPPPPKRKKIAPVVLPDPSRPVLHRRAGSEGDRAVPAAEATPSPDEDDPNRPRLTRAEPESTAAPAAAASAEAMPEAVPGRPILRRGKPLQPSEPGLPAQAGGGTPEPVLLQVAVSDAGPSQPQELLFALPEPQRQQLEQSARELAQSELRRMAPLRGLKLAANQPLTLQDEQFVPYNLDYSDYVTVVFSGRYRPAAADPASGAGRSWVVTVIARRDGDNLVRLYSAVSDPRALNLYPEVSLVDAVDPEGYGRYALLFREQKRDGVSWLLGQVNGYEMQTLFETAER